VIDYQKTTFTLSVLLVVALILLFMRVHRQKNTYDTDNYFRQQLGILKTENENLKASISKLGERNKQIDSLVECISKKKDDIRIIYIEKSKEIDNGSADYLVNQFLLFLAKSDTRK